MTYDHLSKDEQLELFQQEHKISKTDGDEGTGYNIENMPKSPQVATEAWWEPGEETFMWYRCYNTHLPIKGKKGFNGWAEHTERLPYSEKALIARANINKWRIKEGYVPHDMPPGWD